VKNQNSNSIPKVFGTKQIQNRNTKIQNGGTNIHKMLFLLPVLNIKIFDIILDFEFCALSF